MAQYFIIHPENPQTRLIRQATAILHGGGIIVYPTDSCYALGCHIGDKAAMERMRSIRGVDAKHHFTLVCRNLGEAGIYARIDDHHFRLIKAAIGGGYTFILQATREVPRRLLHPKRKTIGIRIPVHPITQALVEELGEPLLTSTVQLPGDPLPLSDPHEIRARLEHRVDLIIDGGPCGLVPTTVIDMTQQEPVITRQGSGSADLLQTVLES